MKKKINKKNILPPAIIISFLILLAFPGIFKQCKTQSRFGFTTSTPYIGGRINGCEVIMVYVDSGGAFYNAGIRSGDILLDSSFHWVQDYIESFNLPKGTEFEIRTIPNGYTARKCKELYQMPQVTRKIIAP